MISLDVFRQIELRIGEIRTADRISGSDRLLKLTVDIGGERRSIVGGLGQSYTPEELRGLQVVVVANLVPAKIKGIESAGMLLGVGCEDSRAVALLTVNRHVPNGTPVV